MFCTDQLSLQGIEIFDWYQVSPLSTENKYIYLNLKGYVFRRFWRVDYAYVCIYIECVRTLIISSAILEKLKTKHAVSRREIEQCFENRVGNFVEDDREEHRTDPPTLWFVAPTNCDRLLKVIFIFIDGNIHIKSAFEPSEKTIDLYEKLGK